MLFFNNELEDSFISDYMHLPSNMSMSYNITFISSWHLFFEIMVRRR